jgi:hypothetical protein
MYSTPMLPQYVCRKIAMISRRLARSRPNKLAMKI